MSRFHSPSFWRPRQIKFKFALNLQQRWFPNFFDLLLHRESNWADNWRPNWKCYSNLQTFRTSIYRWLFLKTANFCETKNRARSPEKVYSECRNGKSKFASSRDLQEIHSGASLNFRAQDLVADGLSQIFVWRIEGAKFWRVSISWRLLFKESVRNSPRCFRNVKMPQSWRLFRRGFRAWRWVFD